MQIIIKRNMDSLRLICDSIKNVVNITSECAEAKNDCPANLEDVAIVGIIALTSAYTLIYICKEICELIKMKKQEGIKQIVEEVLKSKDNAILSQREEDINKVVNEILANKDHNKHTSYTNE